MFDTKWHKCDNNAKMCLRKLQAYLELVNCSHLDWGCGLFFHVNTPPPPHPKKWNAASYCLSNFADLLTDVFSLTWSRTHWIGPWPRCSLRPLTQYFAFVTSDNWQPRVKTDRCRTVEHFQEPWRFCLGSLTARSILLSHYVFCVTLKYQNRFHLNRWDKGKVHHRTGHEDPARE
jgi:hypothetical protein